MSANLPEDMSAAEPTTPDLGGDPIRAILLAHCAAERAGGWRIEDDHEPDRLWTFVKHERTIMREQGWKLHISAGLASFAAILTQALPVLLAEPLAFKVVASLRKLAQLNSGEFGASQIGKFVTIYPSDDEQAVRLAVALDQATRGLRGPAIPTDRPLTPGSLIYYRYGGFADRNLQTHAGQLLPAIIAPDGELIPDRREHAFTPPDWAIDPFRAAGAAPELPKLHPLIGRRYLVMATIYSSARGTVARAVDIATPQRCILKRAGHDAMMLFDGRDARDSLRHEADLLRRLAPDPRFPKVFDLFEHDSDLILAMEDVQGDTLAERIGRLARLGRSIPTAQIIAWGRELAATLATLHAQRIIYRDLKSLNILVTADDRPHLIDFGIAHDLCSAHAPFGPGTRGYMSPQQARGAPPAVADDIYGMGALLFHLATGAEPSLACDPLDLLGRPLAALNPAIDPDLAQLIAGCLAPDPARRFRTIAALDDALAAIETRTPIQPPPFGGMPVERGDIEWRSRMRGPAERLGDMLCAAVQPATSGAGRAQAAGTPGGRLGARDLYDGLAGGVLVLAELVDALDRPGDRAALIESARQLAAAPPPDGRPALGFYTGEAGIGAALLRAGRQLDDAALIAAAAERGRTLAAQPQVAHDLMDGSAGRLRFCLLLWDALGDDAQLQAAIAGGAALLAAADEAGPGELCWRTPESYAELGGKVCLGYGYGAAGIGDALLDLFEATAAPRFLAAAQSAGRWLARLAVPALEDGSGLAWPRCAGEPAAPGFWCHGAMGIGRFFLHAAALDAIPHAAEIAERAARLVARGTRAAGPTQCHGLAGSIEFLLDMFQATGDARYLNEARSLAQLLETFLAERDGRLVWSERAPEPLTPSYMAGYAGVLACLLRLADPEQRPHRLSRAGFFYRSGSAARTPGPRRRPG